jgi:FKBP-type peptidyl-prolyl cis-trans isomerase 2
MARPLAQDEAAISDWIILLALVIAVVVALGAYFVAFAPQPIPVPKTAQQGDSVSIDYIGYFPNSDLVFDTSLQSVAQDNSTYPKAYSFTFRSGYSPLQFTIGDGSVVAGFDQGVRGLAVGQTRTISVPPSLGYGAANANQIFEHTLVETVPVRVTMNATEFNSYYGQVAVSGTNVTDPVYGWSAQVSVLGSAVVVTNSPYPSQAIRPYGSWDAVVLGIDDAADNGTGAITIQNHLDSTMVDKIGGKSPAGETFYLSAVDSLAGTYTLNFNKQVVGLTLVFQVTLVHLSSNF